MLLVQDHTGRTTSLMIHFGEEFSPVVNSLGTKPCARCFTFIQPCEINIYHFSRIRKVRFRQVNSLVQGHTARKGRI